MSYTVESTETFEKEFSKNHKDKKRVASTHGRETGTRTAVRKAFERQASRTMAAQNRSFKVWYEINEEQKKVMLRVVLHKDEAKKYY